MSLLKPGRTSRLLVAFVLSASLIGCRRRRDYVDSVPTLAYPAWASSLAVDEAALVLRAGLQGSVTSLDRVTIERYELRRNEQGAVARMRIERPVQVVSIEVDYDRSGKPLRMWQRTVVPGANPPRDDVRVIEMRVTPVALSHRDFDNEQTFERARNPREPSFVITAAATSLTHWLRAARLRPNQQTRAIVFDMERGGVVQEAVLRREDDMQRPELGGNVRVYRLYGRDVYFADENDVVIGTLAGFAKTATAAPIEADSFERVSTL